ncbi:MAG: CDP-alcohol phosphatidyltransferase family protein [Acidimicrobiales bacterium]
MSTLGRPANGLASPEALAGGPAAKLSGEVGHATAAGAPTGAPAGAPTRPAGAPADGGLMTAANGVTLARIAATPALVLVVLSGIPSWTALLLWLVLALSDAADGWVARRRGTSASGAFLDPLADKFLVLGAMAAIAALGDFTWAPVALLAAREALITSYRVVVARQGVSVPARRSAKAKTLVEFLTVAFVLVPVAGASRGDLTNIAHVALWLAVVLAWASAAQYLLDSRSAGRRAFAGNA